MTWEIALPLAIGIGLFIYGHFNLRLKPILVGLSLAYLSFPVYYALSILPISYHARIVLQIIAFMAIFGYLLYTLSKHMEKVKEGLSD